MKRNTDPRNRLPFVYDLGPDELERFYRGAGQATIVVDITNTIIACVYVERESRDAEFIKPRPARNRWMEGVMSCSQFCATDEGRISPASTPNR